VTRTRQQMQEAGKPIYPTDTGHKAHANVSFEPIKRAKSASGYQNAELKRLAFLRLHLPDAMYSNVRSASLLINTRPASLQQNAGLIKSAFLKCH